MKVLITIKPASCAWTACKCISYSVASLTLIASTASAQVRSVREAATTYGARLDRQEISGNANQHRINNRAASRINNRLSLRLERYRPDITSNPTDTFATMQSDGSRISPVVSPMASMQDGE